MMCCHAALAVILVISLTHLIQAEENPCVTDPCGPHSQQCYFGSEKPLLNNFGLPYVCICKRGYGGLNCQIGDPCATCPDDTSHCWESNLEEDGRYCYDKNHNLLDKTSNLYGDINTFDIFFDAGEDPCKTNPCGEHAQHCMFDSEKPLLNNFGIPYTCQCEKGYGGFHCEIEDPCSSCPAGTVHCMTGNVEQDGKYCFDAEYNILDRTTNIYKANDFLPDPSHDDIDDPCVPDPCGPHAQHCMSGSEKPLLANFGIPYLCVCEKGYGGFQCDKEKPCESCPAGTVSCWESNTDRDGRYCYDKNFNVLDETSNLH